jgi:hypothetical protein
MVLPSADKTRLTRFILSKKISSKRPSLAADGNTIMNLPWYSRKIVHFSLVLSPSRPKISIYATKKNALIETASLIFLHNLSWRINLFDNFESNRLRILKFNNF